MLFLPSIPCIGITEGHVFLYVYINEEVESIYCIDFLSKLVLMGFKYIYLN